MESLKGKVALVAGASRAGGRGIPIRADLSDNAQVAAVFDQIGRLDILANSIWSPNRMAVWSTKFWDLETSLWRDTLETVSACWLTSVHAARLMANQGGGLIVHVTDNYPDASGWRGQVLHDLGHECIDCLIMGTYRDAARANITVVGMNPGFMRTERVLMHMKTPEIKKQFRFDLSESLEYVWRAVAALAADPQAIKKTGRLLWAADLAKEYGLTDVDGRYIPRFDPQAPEQDCPW